MPDEAEIPRLRRTIRINLGVFIVGLVVSGLTAFQLLTELQLLCAWLGGATRSEIKHRRNLSTLSDVKVAASIKTRSGRATAP